MSGYESILAEQNQLIDAIKSINVNFQKDGASRKTSEYVTARLDSLEKFWNKFDENNQILTSSDGDRSGPYFDKNTYNKLKDLYVATREMIMAYVKQHEVKPGAGTSHDQRTNELFNEQRSNIRAFERAIRNLNIELVTEKWQLEDKLKTITSRWEQVDKTYWKLDELVNSMEAYEKDYDRLECMYEETKAALNKKIWSQTHQEKSAPKIDIPTFNGSYALWPTFKDLFTESIHLNTFIPDSQKMQHLKSKLRGEAERLVQHLNISSENYVACWSILQLRYDNTRLLFSHHANALLNQPSMQQPSAAQLKRMHDVTLESLHAIDNLNISTKSWDPLLVHILIQKLDSETTQGFIESLKNPKEVPSLDSLLKYLENKFIALESSSKGNRNIPEKQQTKQQPIINTYKKFNQPSKPSGTGKPFTPRTFHNAVITCPNCTQQHGLYSCKEFIDMTPEQKLKTVEKLKVCKNCLFSHNGNECTSTKTCKCCKKNHSSLLHDAIVNTKENKGGQRLSSHLSHDDENEVLLATAQIQVKTAAGTYVTLRALLDQGSQVTLITENAAQQLNIKRSKMDAVVSGLGASPSIKCKGSIRLTCKALHSGYTFNIKALIMNTLTSKLPNKTIDKQLFEHLQQIQLADPQFHISNNIDILLGADVYSDILMDGLIKKNNSTIIAQQTHLGWIVCGKYKSFNCHVTLNNMEDLSKFWEQEEILEHNIQHNIEDKCETFYSETTTRLSNGQYQVRLPLKPDIQEQLGTSKPQAIAQFKQLERKMSKNPTFASAYKDFIAEYQELGHMQLSTNMGKIEYFMPHHGVVRVDAVTTKLRTVFNASQKTNTKHSLNDLMECGPNLQTDLQSILLQWRQYRYVLTADIEKMYRFIAMHPDDQPLQKIIWRDSPVKPLQEFQLCTVTYGTKAAPYLALKTLKQLATDEGDKYPKAKPILMNNFYVDDAIFGCHTVEEARLTRDQLIDLLRKGNFNLRKWSSNEPRLIEDLPENMRNPLNFDFSDTKTSKTLGLGWNAKSDEFMFNPVLKQIKTKTSLTKRNVLSEMSTLFDPLGWLSPITIKTKILFQQIWKSKIDWDEQIPDELQKEWVALRNELTSMEQFKIKRWLGIDSNIDCELHAFCDASEKAYACVVYSTVRNREGTIQVTLIAAKTKVTPLKQQPTLPRLELCGAVLLAKLINKIKNNLNKQNIKVTAWTDSMVVLGWLNGDINRWKAFVSNRVREILSIIPAESWKHVRSEQNPADCASRGLLPSQLSKFPLWWEGPEWLKQNIRPLCEDNAHNNKKYTTNNEAKVHTVTMQNSDPNIIDNILNKCNSITKAVGVIGWISRFTTNARGPLATRTYMKHLTIAEVRHGYSTLISHVQHQHFIQEITDLKTKGQVNKNSKIFTLNPLLGENNILRVNGRLVNSYLPESAKYPIILPQHNRLTQMLIEQAHKSTLHGGARLTMATLRQRYWILGGSNTIKKHIRLCVRCCRFRAANQQQLMGNLPKVRVTPSKPFQHTGVDYTGHVDVKLNKGRGVKTSKGYIAVFVCMATKAVHLELVSDLSSQTFILALKRMVARRGVPSDIYCDNGTNFVGANKELQKQLKALKTFENGTFSQELNNMGIQFHFNAPSWPSAGGIWESAVRSMKHHLKRVLGEQKLTFEEFYTLLAQIEACLNSRPLCPLTEDVEDLDYLSPGHFLIGQPLISVPHENLNNIHISPRNRWQLVEKMHQDFWKKWSSEYLQQLHARSKWNRRTANLKIDDIVLIKEDNLPPTRWSLGRVQELHPGSDELVRVVTLKTKHGSLKRPITKLLLLPVEQHEISTSSGQQNASPPENKPPQQNSTFKGTNRRRRGPLLSLVLTVLALIQPSVQVDYVTTTALEQNKPVYFDEIGRLQSIHDNWKIVTYYNMTSYWLGVENIGNLIQHVDRRCKRISYQVMCQSIMTELNQEVDELKHNNYMLTTHHGLIPRRFKRGLIDGVGYVANSLFGILDERFAEKYQQDIKMIQYNEHHLLKLMKNQTSVIEAHNNILKRNEEAMQTQFNLIQKTINTSEIYLNMIGRKQNEEENMVYFNMMAMSANIILTKLRHIQQMLLDTATNVHHGQIDTRLLNQDQLMQELNIISGQLPSHLSIPVDSIQEQLVDIYKLLKVKSRVIENFFIIEITLPLASDTKFSLYRTIPLPVKHNNRTFTINPVSEYVAINLRKEIYMLLSEKNLEKCVIIGLGTLLCSLPNPTFNMRSDTAPCEVHLITNINTKNCTFIEETCTDRWVALHLTNSWLYHCCDECRLRLICQQNMITRSVRLSGIIRVDQGCIIKHGEATFYTQLLHQSNININPNIQYVPTQGLTNINNITSHILPFSVTLNKTLNIEQLDDLGQRIKQIEEKSTLEDKMSSHDIHQYAVSYTTLGTVVAVLVVAGCIYKHCRRQQQTQASSAALGAARRREPASGTGAHPTNHATTSANSATAEAFDV